MKTPLQIAVQALEKIARWHDEFPPTGKTYEDGTPVSYGAAFGSNGQRDYMRQVALDALSALAIPNLQNPQTLFAAGAEPSGQDIRATVGKGEVVARLQGLVGSVRGVISDMSECEERSRLIELIPLFDEHLAALRCDAPAPLYCECAPTECLGKPMGQCRWKLMGYAPAQPDKRLEAAEQQVRYAINALQKIAIGEPTGPAEFAATAIKHITCNGAFMPAPIEDVRGTSREEQDQFETAFQWMVEDAGGNSVFNKYEKFQTREYGTLYRNTFTEARWEGWSARAKLEAGRASLQVEQAPVAFVPVHPRTGPLWANAITSTDQDHPRYPLMPVYAVPQGAAPIQSRDEPTVEQITKWLETPEGQSCIAAALARSAESAEVLRLARAVPRELMVAPFETVAAMSDDIMSVCLGFDALYIFRGRQPKYFTTAGVIHALECIAALQGQQAVPLDGWISVKDRLPELTLRDDTALVIEGRVIDATLSSGKMMVTLDGGGVAFDEYASIEGSKLSFWATYGKRVIAWQPRPAPYKE